MVPFNRASLAHAAHPCSTAPPPPAKRLRGSVMYDMAHMTTTCTAVMKQGLLLGAAFTNNMYKQVQVTRTPPLPTSGVWWSGMLLGVHARRVLLVIQVEPCPDQSMHA